MKIGEPLHNGRTVVTFSTNDRGHTFVLAVAANAVHPYATWAVTKDGDTIWGHYHLTFDQAVADYHDRLRGHLRQCEAV